MKFHGSVFFPCTFMAVLLYIRRKQKRGTDMANG